MNRLLVKKLSSIVAVLALLLPPVANAAPATKSPDDDLRALVYAGKPNDNGYDNFVETAALVATLSGQDRRYLQELLIGKHDDMFGLKAATDIVTKSDPAIAKLADLAQQEGISNATWEDALTKNGKLYERLADFVFQARAESYILAHDGQSSEAITRMAVMTGIGNKLMRSANPAAAMRLGIATRRSGLEALLEDMAAENVDDESLSYMINANQGWPDVDRYWVANYTRASYERFLTDLDRAVARGEVGMTTATAREKMAPYFRLLMAQAQKPCYEKIRVALPTAAAPAAAAAKRDQLYLKTAFESALKDVVSFRNDKCEVDALSAASMAQIGLRKNEQAGGKLPKTLAALVPKYMASVPIDPYSGRPLKYNAAKKVVYSVGANKKDEGSSKGSDWRKMADPTWTIRPVPPLPKHVFYGFLVTDWEGADLYDSNYDHSVSYGASSDNDTSTGIRASVSCTDGRYTYLDEKAREIKNFGAHPQMLSLDMLTGQWIFYIDDASKCTFRVSSELTAGYIARHPESAKGKTDLHDSYTAYARNIDPQAKDKNGIYTSEKLTKENLRPGEVAEYKIGGTLPKPVLVKIGVKSAAAIDQK